MKSFEQDFLPGALEIQETPPSPAGRTVLWLLLTLFCAGVLWASFGEVDIVVTAPGRIIPSGQVKVVQAPEAGLVSAIHVVDGQYVEEGEALLGLDDTYTDADSTRTLEQLNHTSVEIGWRKLLERWLEKGAFGVAGDSYESKEDDYIFRQKQREIRARYLSLEEELGANQAEQDAVMAEWDRTQSTLNILEERVAAYRALMDKQNGAKIQYLEMLQQQTDMAKSLPIFTSRQRQLSSSAEALKAQRQAMINELRNQNLLALAQLQGEKASIEQEYRKAARRHGLQLVRAPVSGAVQELAVHTVGGVVQSAQTLMKIVPDGAIIEVEALLRNQDIGFVQEGQPSVVKIDAYNFTKYGLLDAFVANISNDAIEDQQLGWAFKIRLQLKSEELAVGNKWVKVVPGMSVVAEIKTGKRRLIEFFLSPLLRYKQESIRER